MTDFDDLADLWRKQAIDAGVSKRADVIENVRRRRAAERQRPFTWGVALAAIVLVLFQAPGVADAIMLDRPLLSLSFVSHQLAYVAMLLFAGRRIIGYRSLHRRAAGSVRENLAAELRVVEAEMWDLRAAAWIGPWLLLLPLFVAEGAKGTTVASLAESATSSLLFGIVVGGIAWHYYRGTLVGRRLEIEALLAELPAR